MVKKGKKNNSNSLYYWYASILIFILTLSIFLFYKENNKGILQIEVLKEDVKIFINEEDKGMLNIKENNSFLKISQGNHTIILSKDGFWPWVTDVNIIRKQTLKIYPFFIPQNTGGFIISETDPEYQNILSLFNTKTRIDWKKNENTPEMILNFEKEIRASDFYKNRDGVIIIAIQNGIFALEINSGSIPNFQPIYKGVEPTFVKKDNDSLYVKDGKILMEVVY